MHINQQLRTRIAQRRLSHAYLVTGQDRMALANYLAAAYVCTGTDTPPCGTCAHCRKAAAGIHPDILRFGADGDPLKVDAMRALRADAYIRPNEAPRKVYLIENAQDLNASGQNILLKLLEEGPAYAAFLFLTPNPEQLLPTVRSRCETLRAEGEAQQVADHQEAEELVQYITAQNALALAEYLVGLEKRDRSDIATLLDCTLERLIAQAPQAPALLLPRIRQLRTVRAACDFNIGVGHVVGWLLALLTEPIPVSTPRSAARPDAD